MLKTIKEINHLIQQKLQ